MYKIIRSVIESKDYKLEDMLYKISKMYIENRITEEEKSELDNLARSNAKVENSYADTDTRIENIYKELEEVKSRLDKLENKEDSTEDTTTEEYPDYKQPAGAHDAYKIGDKVTYNGKKYICKMDNCVWAPDVYPLAWEEVVATEVAE